MAELRQSPSSIANLNNAAKISSTSIPEARSGVCARWREKIVEWKYQVVDRFDLDRELVSISTFYLDRYLSMKYVDEELFQLVAMASIYLAIKIHSPQKVTIRSIASTGNDLITTRHIEAMELSIMKSLDWRLHPPTTVAFLENYFPLLEKEDDEMTDCLEFSRFLSELSVCAYPFVSAKPSSIAVAAMLYSLEYFGQHFKGSRCQKLMEELGLDPRSKEVEACGTLLMKVHQLAMHNED
eukprot:CAMPEP_0196159844 /NCGR_PEP_ID=MMETSP0910-20130528/46526_1 /TAXON_ID=49265 /ORGANISM="Thalassiosira rotula, Strain GSO102" /LENGTH=239 /DNA_ID=CAMNT_0041424769 /DNA_START=475 /DNA_END=1194 /DNA_ORIENTATION=-